MAHGHDPKHWPNYLPSRKRLHVLHGWERGEDTPTSADSRLNDLGGVIDIWPHALLRLNMLAVHQEEQEALYQPIQAILLNGHLPVSVRDRCRLYRA